MIPSLGHEYYKKMMELQEQLRRSEAERIRLEERFSLIEQESRFKQEACINKLRMRYIEFLEEQRIRDTRNQKLLCALDRIDESLALMTAKSDRLCSMRKEYDTALMQSYVNRRQAGSVTGDSGVVSQNEERQSTKDFRILPFVTPRLSSHTDRKFHTSCTIPGISGNLHNLTNKSPLHFTAESHVNHNDLFHQGLQTRTADYERNNNSQLLPHEPKSHTWTGRYTNNNLSTKELSPFQYPERLGNATRLSKLCSVLNTSDSKGERTNDIVDNELDRYINKIRSLHDINNTQSLEEIEQNTSGDLLNVTLSDDGLDHLPVEEKSMTREKPTDVGVTLAPANNLISRTADEMNMKDGTSHAEPCQSAEEITNINPSQKSLTNMILNNSNIQHVTPTLLTTSAVEDKISDDVVMHTTESNSSAKSNDSLAKPTGIDSPLHSNYTQFQKGDVFSGEPEIPINTIDALEITDLEKPSNELKELHSRGHSGIANGEELWNAENIQNNVQDTSINENLTSEKSALFKSNDPIPNVEVINIVKKNEDENVSDKNEINIGTETIANSNISSADMNIEKTSNVDYGTSEENYEISHPQQFEQVCQQDAQGYSHDPNQIYEYSAEQYHSDPNQQYQYDPNLQYEQPSNEQYEYSQQNPQYIEDPNAQYQDQQYINNDNQQYGMNPDGQYHEYSGHPDQQYESEAYIQDPNAMYAYPLQNESYIEDKTYDATQASVPDQPHSEYQEQSEHFEIHPNVNEETLPEHQAEPIIIPNDNKFPEHHVVEPNKIEEPPVKENTEKKSKNVINHILDSDTDSTMEKNISNTESDFDFN